MYRIRLKLGILLLFTAVPPCFADNPTELDQLLRVISQGGVVDNTRLTFTKMKASEKTSQSWISAAQELAKSNDRTVASAAKKLQPAIDKFHQAKSTEKAAAELTTAIMKKSGPSGTEMMAGLNDLLFGLNDVELDNLRAAGKISKEDYDAFLKNRNNLNSTILGKFQNYFAQAYPIKILSSQKQHRLVNEGDMLAAQAADDTRNAIRSRAGKENSKATLQLRVGLEPGYDYVLGIDRTQAFVDARWDGTEELTRVSIRLELNTTHGSRTAWLYAPKIRAGGWAMYDGIPLAKSFLKDAPAKPEKLYAAIKTVKYSVYCDQFRAEDLELSETPLEEVLAARTLLAIRPGMKYVSKGGTMPNMSSTEILAARKKDPNFRLTPEEARRYEFTVKKFNPSKPTDGIELELKDTQAPAGKNTGTFKGTVKMPVFKKNKKGVIDTSEYPELSVRNGSSLLVLKLRADSQNQWAWTSSFREFLPDSAIAESGTPEGDLPKQMVAAMKLASSERKYDEAKTLMEKVIKEHPGTPLEAQAKTSLDALERIKEAHKKLDTMPKKPFIGRGPPM